MCFFKCVFKPGVRQLSVTPYRQAWQADIGLSKQINVQGVTIQTDVLQVMPNKLAVMVVTEGVLMQRLDVVVLQV